MSVPSRGRYVPHSAPLTARNLRSPQDRNRLPPLARPTPPDLPRRSMSASTIRLVRHSIPLSLSIAGRPHQAGPIRSWRADSLVFVWLDPGITPCCRSLEACALERSDLCPEAVIPAYVLSGAAARKGDDKLGEHTVLRLDGD